MDLGIATVVAETVTDVSVESVKTISTQAIGDHTFFLWLMVPVLTVMFTAHYGSIRDSFYKNHFETPVKPFMVMIFNAIVGIMKASAIIYYMWHFMNPAAGSDTDWYVSNFSLWFTIEAFFFAWGIAFWIYGGYKVGLGIALFLGIGMNLMCFILTGFFFYRLAYVSGALTLIVSIAYLGLLVFNGLVLVRSIKTNKRASRQMSVQDDFMVQDKNYREQQQQYYAPQNQNQNQWPKQYYPSRG